MVLTGGGRGGVAVAPPLLAISAFTAANYYRTAVDGGEAGITTGFGNVTWGRFLRFPTGGQVLRRRIDGSGGWMHWVTTTGIQAVYYNPSAVVSSLRPFSPSDQGSTFVFLSRITAVPGQIETWMNRHQIPGSALSAYTLPSAASRQLLGVDDSLSSPASGFDLLGELDFRGVPSAAQILAFLDALRTGGNIPTVFAGATVTHRWSLIDALAGQTVVDGQTAPATLADTITGATADIKTRVGSPVVRRIESSVEGRKVYGTMAFSASSYLRRVATTFRGAVAGHWFALLCTLRTSSSGAAQYLVDLSNGANGFRIARVPATDKIEIYCYGAVNITSVSANITAADRDTMILLLYTFDGSTHAVRTNRGAVISGAGSYALPTSPTFTIGNDSPSAANPSTDAIVYRAAGGVGVLTQAEIDAMIAAFESQRTLVPVPGKTALSYDFSQDIAPTPDTVPASVQDRAGSDHLTRAGSDLLVSRRTERLFGYETTPIARGFTASATAHYRTAAALADVGNVASWWYVVARQDAQTVGGSGNATQILLSSNPPGVAGVTIAASATTLLAGISGAAGGTFNSSGNATIAAGDVGKLDVILGVFTGSQIVLYRKRAFAVQAAASPTLGVSTSPMYLGSESSGTPRYADRWTIYGGGAGVGVPTLAQYQALYDWIVSEDGLAQPMPGLATAHVWRIPAASALPATVTDAGTSPNDLTRINAPSDLPQYARAFAA